MQFYLKVQSNFTLTYVPNNFQQFNPGLASCSCFIYTYVFNFYIAFHDKSLNIYKIEPKFYKTLLEKKHNSTLQKMRYDTNTIKIINKEAQKIISNLKIPGKTLKFHQQDAFII